MSRLRQLISDAAVYGLGSMCAKGIGFFLLPVYTRIFSPPEYGAIEMLVVVTAFLSAFLGMGMDSAQSMYFFKEKDRGIAQQRKVVSSILQWRLTWGTAIVVLSTVASPIANFYLFGGKLGWAHFAIAFSGALAAQIMGQSVEVLRLLYRPWPYVGMMLLQNVIAATAILVLVLVFDQQILGYFLGTTLAALLSAAGGWWLVREYVDFSTVHWDRWSGLLHFGAPLLLSDLAFYFMNSTDRWFIQHYRGEAELGIYALGAKLAMLMALAIETFRKAWWPIAMDAMFGADGPETYRMIARLFAGVTSAAVVVVTLMSPWLVRWFAAPEYHEAWPIVGILAWQSVFYGFYLVASAGIWRSEKTYLSALLMVVSAVLNIVLNYALVPRYGNIGAALATAITYFLWVTAAMIVSEKLWKIGFPVGMLTLNLALAGTTGYWLIGVQRGSFGFLAASGALVVAGFLVAASFDRAGRTAILTRLAQSLGGTGGR